MGTNTSDMTPDEAVPGISRRDSLKWFGLMLAGNLVATVPGCGKAAPELARDSAGHWPNPELKAVDAPGYGQDPDLVSLTTGPWPKTLTAAELTTVSLLADILVPREGATPSAAELHVEAAVDEWVSAPYEAQQADRLPVASLLQWLDDEAAQRFDRPFAATEPPQRLAIVDDIAWFDSAEAFRRPAEAFDRLRRIVVSAYFCTPEGSADLGYLGGQVIAGDYPGPTREALQHFRQMLATLELDEVTDPASQTGRDA
jgi:Gluconate 2-dehydrogenase subunit 3